MSTDTPPLHPPGTPRDQARRALLALATSTVTDDRCDAARCLALFAGIDEVDRRLVLLACDPEVKNVTSAAIEALAQRADRVGWRLIAEAFAAAPDSSTREDMMLAIENALAWDWVTPENGLHELQACATDEEPTTAAAAAEILREIAVPTADDAV